MAADVATQLFDAGVRIERIIWLDGVVCADRAGDDFRDFFEDAFGDLMQKLLPEIPADFDGDAADAIEHMLSARGFLVQAASPVRTYYSDGELFSSGWGHYRTEWFRVYEPADSVPLILAWAEALNETDRAKAKAA